MKKMIFALFGTLVGAVNGTLGAGGGLFCVPLLKKSGLPQKRCHSTAVAVLLPISLLSAAGYLREGYVSLSDARAYILPSILGAAAGTVFLSKISSSALSKIFSIIMIYAGVRLFLR